ncbi:MAG: glutamine amidotransferase [Solirubrobacterales bacterium]
MCGIAGIIYKNGTHPIGKDMTAMLQAMKHRGPDSTGFALYGTPQESFKMRITLADTSARRSFDFADRLLNRRAEVEGQLRTAGATVTEIDETTEYTSTFTFDYGGDLKLLADRVESVRDTQVLSLGHSLEIVKDIGDAETVAEKYKLDKVEGTHAIGHVRMATESDVDIAGAHPYWAYPFSDVAVVHNGQLTNYFYWRRRLERNGHRFQSECDSEIIAVYLAEKMEEGLSLEEAMNQSMEDLDGVFTYLCVTSDSLGMAKDELAAKPLVLYESDDIIALASEEISIRKVVPGEIDTYDPFEGEVMVWTR